MKHANVAIFVPHEGCPHQCSFCDQRSISGARRAPDAAEISEVCGRALAQLGERACASEIAFFGGSFTAIDRSQMLSLLEAARPYIGAGKFRGVRVSTRPDAIDPQVLATLREYGVTAIELGAQSMDDEVLRLNRRGHTALDVEEASNLIRAGGFELGLQMMVGLYGDTEEKTMATARKLAALQPQTMRVYPTVVVRSTLLAELYEQGFYQPLTVSEAVRIAANLLEFFEGRGIRVIRLGLHASETLEESLLAGGYHPALRELCESHLFLQKFSAHLDSHPALSDAIIIKIPRGCASKAAGHHRSNTLALAKRGVQAKFYEDESLSGYEFTMLPASRSQ